MTLADLGLPSLTSSFWLVSKAFILVALSIYLVFALVVVRQVNHMTDTLEVGFETAIRIFALLHLLFALTTLVIAIMVL